MICDERIKHGFIVASWHYIAAHKSGTILESPVEAHHVPDGNEDVADVPGHLNLAIDALRVSRVEKVVQDTNYVPNRDVEESPDEPP